MKPRDKIARQNFFGGVYGHTMAIVNKSSVNSLHNLVFSFGGVNNMEEAINELFLLDISEREASIFTLEKRGVPPSPRYRHTMTYVETSNLLQ